MNWKRKMMWIGAFLFCSASFAQIISFDSLSHNFGTFVKPKEGGVSCDFYFVNTGDVPLLIHKVVTTCGCTTPEYTEEPIAAGQKGNIKVTYSATAPGAFSKTITVYSNSKDGTVRLNIKGTAQPYRENPLESYPKTVEGGLRLVTKEINFQNIAKGLSKSTLIEVYNENAKPIKLSFVDQPSYMKISVVPESLMPHTKGSVIVSVDTKGIKAWGRQYGTFHLIVEKEKASTNNEISFSYNLVDDILGMTEEQKKMAPVLSFSTRSVDLGKMKVNEKKKERIILTNKGKSPLIIYAVNTNSKNMVVIPEKMTIPVGKEITVKILFEPKNKKEIQKQTIEFITNAPNALSAIVEINVQPR